MSKNQKLINYDTKYAIQDEYRNYEMQPQDRIKTPIVPVMNARSRNMFHIRNAQVAPVPVDHASLNQLRLEAQPRDVAPLPKASTYALANTSEPIKAWQTVKIFDRQTVSIERREPKLKVYHIAHGPPLDTPDPKWRVYAINRPADDSHFFQQNPQRVERFEYEVRSSPPPQQKQLKQQQPKQFVEQRPEPLRRQLVEKRLF